MPDEPTLGEVVRRLEAVHADLKEDLREYGHRLDTKVSLERYQLEQEADQTAIRRLGERVTAVEKAREQEQRDRRTDRRLIFSALVAPVLIVLFQAYMSAKGAGG